MPEPAQWTLPKLQIDVNGDWFDGDVQITHPGILANLRTNLRRDAEGYFIQARVRIPVAVTDTPFAVTRIEQRGQDVVVSVNDGTEETIDPRTLRMGAGEVPYCAIKAGRFEARLTRAAAYQLLGMAESDPALRGRLGR